MEPVPTKVIAPAASWAGRLLLLAVLTAAGCMNTPKLPSAKPAVAFDPTTPNQLAVTWNPKVQYAADPTRGGTIMPVLTGRMYLFASDQQHPPSYPLVYDGKLTVDLWDHTPVAGKVEPKMLEQWIIDPETMSKLMKEDIIGMGYSLGLPWSTYREDMTGVHIIVRFDPTNGKPHILQQGGVTIDHTATKELESSSLTR